MHVKWGNRFLTTPLFLSLYSVLALLASNVDQIAGAQVFRALVISFFGTLIALVLVGLMIKDWHRAALIVSLFVLLFFSYGHVYAILKHVSLFGVLIGRHRILLPLWLGLSAIGLYWLSNRLQNPIRLSRITNVIVGMLILFPLATIALFEVRSGRIKPQVRGQILEDCDLSVSADSQPPDIYYIILDAYAREDDLQEVYEYDNYAFLDTLRGMGFYIAEQSRSNYPYTLVSVTSSLNMDYLQTLNEKIYSGAPYDAPPTLCCGSNQ